MLRFFIFAISSPYPCRESNQPVLLLNRYTTPLANTCTFKDTGSHYGVTEASSARIASHLEKTLERIHDLVHPTLAYVDQVIHASTLEEFAHHIHHGCRIITNQGGGARTVAGQSGSKGEEGGE
jgi:hypothetical protein